MPQPELHDPTTQNPSAQAAVAFETTQRLPHREQLLGSSEKRDSHPFDALPSQLPQPAEHDRPQVAIEQNAIELLPDGQLRPHAPQLRVLVRRSVSQPFIDSPSQLPKLVLHTTPHAPFTHDADALLRAGHARPQPPQLLTLMRVSTHEAPHIVRPAAQPERHVPAEQICPEAHTRPHAPQL